MNKFELIHKTDGKLLLLASTESSEAELRARIGEDFYFLAYTDHYDKREWVLSFIDHWVQNPRTIDTITAYMKSRRQELRVIGEVSKELKNWIRSKVKKKSRRSR